jgi:hypothetical protein
LKPTPGNFAGRVDAPIATAPRANLRWLVPNVFCPPAEGGACSVVTPAGDCWVGTLVSQVGRRVQVRLFGSGIVKEFVRCPCAALRPHGRADARQIVERQRRHEPAARFQKRKS